MIKSIKERNPMARTIEDGPESHDLLLEAIARECRDNRAAIGRLDTRFDRLESHLDTRMDSFGGRMDAMQADMNGRFESVNARFDAVDAKFDSVERRLDAMQADMNGRFESVDARFDAVDAKFDAIRARTDQRFDRVDKWMDQATAMMTKQDKMLMRLVILAEGTGGNQQKGTS